MRRYYLSQIIGTGTEDDPYRPKIADLRVNHVAVIPSDPVTGKPKFAWALVIVNTANHTALLSDGQIEALPDLSLDAKLNSLSAAVRNALISRLTAKGISTTGVNVNTTYRDVVRRVGQFLRATFSENNFDVAE